MQKKNDIVIGKASVALRHLFANEDFDPWIKCVDLHVTLNNVALLGDGRPAKKQSHDRDDRFFHIVPPRVLIDIKPPPRYKFQTITPAATVSRWFILHRKRTRRQFC